LSIILFTSFILVLFNPLYLNYDISFHLSFLAVLGLLYTQKFWSKIFFFLPKFFAVRESFILTLSALTTTLPIMVFNFWQISILSPITNLIVWWIIPISMFLWFLSILWNLINEKIWFIIWFPTFFLLKFVNIVAGYFWSLSFSIIKFDYKDYFVYLEIVYFMILVFLIVYFQKESLILEEEIKDV
jgi:competence protein ComEC